MRSMHRRGALKVRLLIAALTLGVASFAAAPAGATVEKLSKRSIGSNGCPAGFAFGNYGTARIGEYDNGPIPDNFRTFISLAAFAPSGTYTAKLIWQDIARPQSCSGLVLGTFSKSGFTTAQFGELTDQLTFNNTFPPPSTSEGFRIYAAAVTGNNALISTPLVCSDQVDVGGVSDPADCPAY